MGKETFQGREIAIVEVGVQSTIVTRLQVIGQTFILLDYWFEEPLLIAAGNSQKIQKPKVAPIISRLGPQIKKLTMVMNDAGSFSMPQKVPVSTEDDIRRHLQQTLSQTHKIDLAKYFWTVSPLASGFYEQQGLTEAFSNKLNVLLCGTGKEDVEALRSSFNKEGVEIEHIVFHIPALVKAFEFYGDKTFQDQIIGLLDLNPDRCSLGFIKNGALVTFRESKSVEPLVARDHLRTHREIKESVLAIESRFHGPAKCIFVSGNYSGLASFIHEMKERRCYSRQWNAARKLSVPSDPEKREQLNVDGVRLNGVIGAALLTLESVQKNITDVDAASQTAPSKLEHLIQPLALAASILIVALATVFNLNSFAADKAKNELSTYSAQQNKAPAKQPPHLKLSDQVEELELFTNSRHRWLSVVDAIRGIHVEGVELSQVRITDTLGLLEFNPFENVANKGRQRKISGTLVIEACNQGGVSSLGAFINAVKTNEHVRPLLNKRATVRMLNNIPAPAKSSTATNATLFAVEYLLEEKVF
jgi:hypothetical protein